MKHKLLVLSLLDFTNNFSDSAFYCMFKPVLNGYSVWRVKIIGLGSRTRPFFFNAEEVDPELCGIETGTKTDFFEKIKKRRKTKEANLFRG